MRTEVLTEKDVCPDCLKIWHACRCYDDRADRIEHKARWLVEQAYDTEDGQAKVVDPAYWRDLRIALERPPEGVPMILFCPKCGQRHLDEGEWATKLHHTHACQGCGLVWRPAIVDTVGVEFLPGFKNSEMPVTMSPQGRGYIPRGR